MTKEEAKTVFLNRGYVEVEGGTIYNPDKWREACAVISKWLEQESCEDAISREDVITLKWQGEASEDFLEGYASAIEDARVLPSVKPQEPTDENLHREREQAYMQGYEDACKKYRQEPKTGHWITKIKSDLRNDMWPTNPKCSECGGEPYYSNTIYNYKFCPYCGAKMVELQERSEE